MPLEVLKLDKFMKFFSGVFHKLELDGWKKILKEMFKYGFGNQARLEKQFKDLPLMGLQ